MDSMQFDIACLGPCDGELVLASLCRIDVEFAGGAHLNRLLRRNRFVCQLGTPRVDWVGSMRLGGVLHDPAVALRRLGLDASGFSIDSLMN